jgi:hypothetical protein
LSADDTAVDISGSLSGAALKFNPIWQAEAVTDKEGPVVVEGKHGAVSETIFKAHAETTLQLDASDAANALLIMDGANTDTINLPGSLHDKCSRESGRGRQGRRSAYVRGWRTGLRAVDISGERIRCEQPVPVH